MHSYFLLGLGQIRGMTSSHMRPNMYILRMGEFALKAGGELKGNSESPLIKRPSKGHLNGRLNGLRQTAPARASRVGGQVCVMANDRV